jgi:hypothetical protein
MHNFAVTQNFKIILLIIALSMTLNLVSEQRCANLKDILVDKDNQWQPLVDKKGKAMMPVWVATQIVVNQVKS